MTNPCLTTEYIAFTIDAVSQEAGQTSYTTFTEPEHTEGQEVNDQSICGAITYTLVKYDGVSDTESAQDFGFVENVSGLDYQIRIHTMDENNQGVHTLRLKMELGRAEYPTYYVDFSVVIQQATCNCNLIVWDEPAQITAYTKLLDPTIYTVTLTKAEINADSE